MYNIKKHLTIKLCQPNNQSEITKNHKPFWILRKETTNKTYLHFIYLQPSIFSTNILHFGHLLQFLFFARFINSISSLSLSSLCSILYSSQLICECQGTLHCAQNILQQLGHSDSLTTSSPSSINIAEQSLKGQ